MSYIFPVTIHLNAKFQPKDRFPLEDALEEVLEKQQLGTVNGGGTLQMKTGEIDSCDIETLLKNNQPETLERLVEILHHFGIPKGSELQFEGGKIPLGNQEGLALYLNGTDLPAEVYQTCDINYLVDKMEELLQNEGSMYSYWEGSTETALYFYGGSFEKMKELAADFVEDYPLCRKCRIVQIA